METRKIIGCNLLDYREKYGYSQDHVANYLGINRSLISDYENAKRDITLVHLNKLCDLFNIELEDFIEPNAVNKVANLAFAFRSNSIDEQDMLSIASFQKVVKNYIKMKKIQDGN